MKVGLIDVDSHNFPNLALMKISAYHKKQGDTVEWYQPLISGNMDKVYKSKVFTFTDDYLYPIDADEVIEGGTGYDIEIFNGVEKFNKSMDSYQEVVREGAVSVMSQTKREGEHIKWLI